MKEVRDMSNYIENLSVLEQFDRKMYENYLVWTENDKEKQVVVQEKLAKDGTAYLEMEKNGRVFRLNSCYSPENEAKEWVQQFSLNNIKQVVMMIGLGNGAFLTQLKKACKEDAIFVIYEPSIELFDHLMHNDSLKRMIGDANVYLMVQGLNEFRFNGIMEAVLNWDNINYLIVTEHPKYKDVYPQEYSFFCEQAKNGWVNANINRNTMGYFGRQIVRNTCENLSYLGTAHFYEQYIGRFGDAPAIIVSAGPSLDSNIEKIKDAKGKAVIIAVDTAMREMDKHGIEPDFIISIDPKKSLRHTQGPIAQRAPLFCSDIAHHAVLKQHEGQKIFFELSPFTEKLKPQQIVGGESFGSGSSVSTAAFALCVALEFKTIILVGQDLAYKNGMSHAGNRMVDIEEQKMFQVEDIFGNKIATRHDWHQFLIWYEEAIRNLEGKVEVIDATEGGARIKGTKIMTLDEAIATYTKGSVDCASIVKSIDSTFSNADYERMLNSIKNVVRDIENTERDVKGAILAFEQLCKCCERKDYGKTYKSLTKDVVRYGESIKARESYILLASWIAKESQEILGNINRFDTNLNDKELQVYMKSLEFYRELEEAVKEVKPLLQDAYEKIKW